MKRTFKYFAMAFLAGMLISTMAFGQATGNGTNYVDKNKDGVCDNFTPRQNKSESGRNFKDADGDGLCDNRTAVKNRKGKCCAQKQKGNRYRGGRK